jgi:Capsular polysaccharide synthesis protein
MQTGGQSLSTCLVKTARSIRQADSRKTMTAVVKRLDIVAWPEPTWTLDNERIIWGFWDDGEEGMPALCQLAIESWRARNPTWTVVIINDHNYQQFVSFSDTPTTFQSLLAQHRSDIIRTAVLLRYGGVYLDASTFMYKGLDQIWEQLGPSMLAITSMHSYPESDFELYNNAVLIARKPNNPVLLEWQRRFLEYMEDPCLTSEQVLEHPKFQRVRQFLSHRSNGIFKDMAPYGAMLWMLSDVICHEPMLRSHILKLPLYEWGFAQFSLPYFIRKVRLERANGGLNPASDSQDVVDWTVTGILKDAMTLIRYHFEGDMDLVSRLTTMITLVKFSTVHLSLVSLDDDGVDGMSVLSQFLKASKGNITTSPTMQATLEGAQRIDGS